MDKIILYWVQIPLHEPFRISSGAVAVKDAIVVEVRDGPWTGYGEASPMAGAFYSAETPESTWKALVERLGPWALGRQGVTAPSGRGSVTACKQKRPFLSRDRRERVLPLNKAKSPKRSISTRRQGELPEDEPFARAGLDGALWDLECRRAGEPLWQRLGSQPRPIPSGVAIGIFDTVDELLERVGRFVAAGYQRVKIKIQPGWDIEPVGAVREKFPRIDLMVDANAAYSIRDLALFQELDGFDLMMYEQPLGREALEDMAELQRAVRTPVCADESAESLDALERILALGSARIINIKIQRVGGLERARRMHDRALAAGLACWLGTMPELGIASVQGLHLATLPGFRYPTDVESSERWYVDDLVDPLLQIDAQGRLHLPPGPGSGFTVNRSKLERYTIQRVELTA